MEFTAPSTSQHNHPYSVKTTQSGILSRSNVGKAHGSWARHHYTPAPPSPSMFVFNPEGTPSPTRRSAGAAKEVNGAPAPSPTPSEKSQKSRKSGLASPSPSKSSKTWSVRNAEGEKVKLPSHPYLWTPDQLVLYLSSELHNSDGESFDHEIVHAMLDFVQKQKISGRTFMTLDQEDFEEMEGVDSVWSNAFWDASCTLRQQALPYRPSRVSSSSYKPGRVRGMVDVFERSASESSDVGEDRSPHKRLGTPEKPPTPQRSVPITQRSGKRRQNTCWDMSETEDDGDVDRVYKETNFKSTSTGSPSRSPANNPFISRSSTTAEPHIPLPDQSHAELISSPAVGHGNNDDGLVPVLPPQSATPLDVVLPEVSEDTPFQPHQSGEPGSPFPVFREPDVDVQEDDSSTPHNTTREIEIASLPPPREEGEEELTMAELYAQTYGEPAPEPRIIPVETSGETMRFRSTEELPTHPPTALRPVKGKFSSVKDRNKEDVTASQGSQIPPGLHNLFVHDHNAEPSRDIYVVSSPGPAVTKREEEALLAVDVLKTRLEIVEAKLAAMEKAEREREAQVRHVRKTPPQGRRSRINVGERLGTRDDEFDIPTRSGTSRSVQIVRDIVFGDGESEAFGDGNQYLGTRMRTWQSASILLAGATTGVSVMLIPLLLRHFWNK
ncbi:hypothetical protein BU17DRAFT_101004 [Hysterangium stoloniferum]|nr:hypothetical protein BU17DRAFT_101004 [Hysterangium stoloniferum]